jgi:zinc ribbon protein
MATFCSVCGQPLAPDVKFCGQCGATTSPAESTPSAAIGVQSGPRCRTCGVGTLRLEKRYRMSTPVVAIGYILLVPSVLGVIVYVLSIVRIAGLSNSDASAMASGILVFFALAAFVGGLLGWLLIMKKKVLCCTHCSAIVPAS